RGGGVVVGVGAGSPQPPPPRAPPPGAGRPAPGGGGGGGPPPRRILLVEDDEDTRQLLAVALEAQGYDLDEAGTADEGLADLRSRRFDLVLTDYDLPGKTGAAMLREAHAAGLLDDAAAMVVTAHPDPEGVDDVTLVRKPLDLEKFLLQVRGIFESMPPGPAAPPPREVETAPADGAASVGADGVARALDPALYVSPASAPSA